MASGTFSIDTSLVGSALANLLLPSPKKVSLKLNELSSMRVCSEFAAQAKDIQQLFALYAELLDRDVAEMMTFVGKAQTLDS